MIRTSLAIALAATTGCALAPSASGALVECDARGGRMQGIAAGIDDSGALLVRVADGVERIVAGEVIWR